MIEPCFKLNEGFKVNIWRPKAESDSAADYVTDHDTDHVERDAN
jgi:hypothetical protein